MNTIAVQHLDGDRFEISTRSHTLTVDQPVSDGGEDTGPTPTELFVASLASCVGFYACRYLARHDLPTDGLSVTATYTMGSGPARVSGIAIGIDVPAGVPLERRKALLAVASHCTVHNSLIDPPAVSIALTDGVAAA